MKGSQGPVTRRREPQGSPEPCPGQDSASISRETPLPGIQGAIGLASWWGPEFSRRVESSGGKGIKMRA